MCHPLTWILISFLVSFPPVVLVCQLKLTSLWDECWAFCLSSGTFPLQFLYKSKVPVEVTSAKWLMGWTGLKDSKNRYSLLEVICKSRSRCLVAGLCSKHFNLSKQHYKKFFSQAQLLFSGYIMAMITLCFWLEKMKFLLLWLLSTYLIDPQILLILPWMW